MKKFFDKAGVEVKEGSILWYDEGQGFAKNIQTVILVNGGLCGVGKVYNYYNEFKSLDKDDPVNLRFYCSSWEPNILTDATVIGHISTDSHMLTVEYANEHYHPINTPV